MHGQAVQVADIYTRQEANVCNPKLSWTHQQSTDSSTGIICCSHRLLCAAKAVSPSAGDGIWDRCAAQTNFLCALIIQFCADSAVDCLGTGSGCKQYGDQQ